MSPKAFLAIAALGVTGAACSASTADDGGAATSDSALSSYTMVTSCDGGAMVVDVAGYPMTPATNHDPDYDVQAVIRDPHIVSYLESRGAVQRNPANTSEAIVRGHVWLSSFDRGGHFDGSFTSEAGGITASLVRYGDGIALRFTTQGSGHVCPSFCTSPADPEYDPTSGVCEGCSRSSSSDEIASWWFPRCPIVADVHR